MYQKRDVIVVVILVVLLPLLVIGAQVARDYTGRAFVTRSANIFIRANRAVGPLPQTWRALAQGGEEKGVRMLENVLTEITDLNPRYIRIDHIYDFYDVVTRDSSGALVFRWDDLDATICDIYTTGAKPFFSLGYMPETMSADGTLIGRPIDWMEWQLLVQKTIERYSGQFTQICNGQIAEDHTDVYYEVWNEPDLESFGSWSIHGGDKDYKTMYLYSARAADQAVSTERFFIGGPAITASYQNWFQLLIKYADAFDLRLDFLSWHHYASDVDSFSRDTKSLDLWLSGSEYDAYRSLPRIITEWGFDSGTNPLSETNIAAAHTISAIRHLIEEDLEMAFAFEIKDGLTPRWGMLTHSGERKPRYDALKMLNVLGTVRLSLEGEGTHVKALASRKPGGISVVLVNYDIENTYSEVVPVTITGLIPGQYRYTRHALSGQDDIFDITIDATGNYTELISMEPNSVVTIEMLRL